MTTALPNAVSVNQHHSGNLNERSLPPVQWCMDDPRSEIKSPQPVHNWVLLPDNDVPVAEIRLIIIRPLNLSAHSRPSEPRAKCSQSPLGSRPTRPTAFPLSVGFETTRHLYDSLALGRRTCTCPAQALSKTTRPDTPGLAGTGRTDLR